MHVQKYSQQLDFKVVLLKFVFFFTPELYLQANWFKKKKGVDGKGQKAHSFKPSVVSRETGLASPRQPQTCFFKETFIGMNSS